MKKKIINLTLNLNALQLNLIAVQKQQEIEKQKALISDHADKNVKDLEDLNLQLRRKIENFNKKKDEEK
tara:strand:+ start:3078 stop:3284 length:207 start_codon:yes stop_codon:yes gene_type:complete